MEKGPKLRFRLHREMIKVVLVEPEIPQNTGSIARTCAATGTSLHLIGKLGFDISEKAVRRAGLDYWKFVKVKHYASFEEFIKQQKPSSVLLFSSRAPVSYRSANYASGCALVFGKETAGLPSEILERYGSSIFGIPTLSPVRSLNLAVSVSIVVYEALGKMGVIDDTYMEG